MWRGAACARIMRASSRFFARSSRFFVSSSRFFAAVLPALPRSFRFCGPPPPGFSGLLPASSRSYRRRGSRLLPVFVPSSRFFDGEIIKRPVAETSNIGNAQRRRHQTAVTPKGGNNQISRTWVLRSISATPLNVMQAAKRLRRESASPPKAQPKPNAITGFT